MPTVIDLAKAKGKSLAAHFHKASAHHEAMADLHEKCQMAHKAHGEHHAGMMGKAVDDNHGHHKASAAFHKAMASHHEKLHKKHAAHAAHHAAMATSQEADTAEKVLKAVEIELTGDETMATTDTDDAVIKAAAAAQEKKEKEKTTAAVAADPASPEAIAKATAAVINPNSNEPDPAAVVTAATSGNATLDKALESGLGSAISSALDRILKSQEFGKIMEEKLANMMLEKLSGQTTQTTAIKTFAVPRDEQVKADLSKVDPQLMHLVSND